MHIARVRVWSIFRVCAHTAKRLNDACVSKPSRLAARLGGSDLRKRVVLAHNRLALPRSAACV
eukprot:5975357-Prymnesium_polylepis.1